MVAGFSHSGNHYDAIMAGGGAAGLSLAYHIAHNSLREPRILVIDRDKKEKNDRTWCYWSIKPTPFEPIAYKTWEKIEFISDDFHQVYSLAPYRYVMVRGIDFYNHLKGELGTFPNIDFLQGSVSAISDGPHGSEVRVNETTFTANWVFDSMFRINDFFTGPPQYHFLKQHFKGWEVETAQDVFNPDVVTMFDFRTPQNGVMRFIYILPFSRRHALVEYTLFSHDLLKPKEYDAAISDYLEQVLKVKEYKILSTETGIIPMTDMPFPRRLGKHIMAIGTRGGMVKPSTGYAFLRVVQDSAAVTRSLNLHGHPFDVPRSHWRYRLFDTLMLQVMYRNGHRMKEIFTSLFKKNSIQAIFDFLNENASPLDNIRLMSTVPPVPFIKALINVKILSRI